jgi:hypothetical protein
VSITFLHTDDSVKINIVAVYDKGGYCRKNAPGCFAVVEMFFSALAGMHIGCTPAIIDKTPNFDSLFIYHSLTGRRGH